MNNSYNNLEQVTLPEEVPPPEFPDLELIIPVHDLASPVLDYKQSLAVIVLHLLQSQLGGLLRDGTVNRLVLLRRDPLVVVVVHRRVQTPLGLLSCCSQLLLVHTRLGSLRAHRSTRLLLQHTEHIVGSL